MGRNITVTKPFYVIIEDNGRFVPYDVISHLIYRYNDLKKSSRPKTREEFNEFVESESRRQWWARCEYEIILMDWPAQSKAEKWDIHKQVMMNFSTIVELLMENIFYVKK